MTEDIPIIKLRCFSPEEYDRRLAATRSRMAEQDLDLLLVLNPENVLYLCGYQSIGYASFMCLALPQQGEMSLFVREMEAGCAAHYAWVDDVVLYSDHEDPVEVLNQALEERGLIKRRIGLELDAAFGGAKRMIKLMGLLQAGEVVDASGTVEWARRIKSPEELAYIRRASRVTEAGMRAAVDAIRAGVTDSDVAAAMYVACFKAGGTEMSSQPIVTAGQRSGVAHTTFAYCTIQTGDMVLLELGGCVNHYTAALMRSAAVGAVPDQARRMAAACREALEAAIGAIAPGATCGEVDAACADVIARAGFEANFRKRTGYSVGVSYAPDWGEGHIISLRHADPTPLQEGMVFHVVPALRNYGRWAAGMSETVLVTGTGCEVLTSFPRELFQCA